MGSNILAEVADGDRARASQINQYFTALVQDILARNSSGEVADSAGSLGSETQQFEDIFLSGSIFMGGNRGGYVPSGTMFPYSASETEAPEGYIFANGDTIGAVGSGADHEGEDYRYLFDKYKLITNYGNAGTEDFDTGDTVLIPNPAGRFVRSVGSINPDSSTMGEIQTGQNISHTHQMQYYYYTSTASGPNITVAQNALGSASQPFTVPSWLNASSYYRNANEGGTEARPHAMTFPYIIKV